MKVWLNGALVDEARARIDPADRGFLLGDGLFETFLAIGGRVLYGEAHLTRLRQGAVTLGIPLDYDDAALLEACMALLHTNGMTARAALRLTLTRGPGARGLAPPENVRPTVLLTGSQAPPPRRSLNMITSAAWRHELSPLSRFKTLNYLDNILARREAEARGADEAVMLNTRGYAAGASAANLWVVEGGALITPPVSDGALPGIMRACVFEVAGGLNIEAQEARLTPKRLAAADEIFLTNSLIGACPVHQFDGRVLRPRLAVRVQKALAARQD